MPTNRRAIPPSQPMQCVIDLRPTGRGQGSPAVPSRPSVPECPNHPGMAVFVSTAEYRDFGSPTIPTRDLYECSQCGRRIFGGWREVTR